MGLVPLLFSTLQIKTLKYFFWSERHILEMFPWSGHFTVREILNLLFRQISGARWDHFVSYQLMLEQSKRTVPRGCCLSVSSVPHTAFTCCYLTRIHVERCLLPLCMSSCWMSTSSSLLVGAAYVALCLCGYHVPVGVGWLSHCHSLDVMRKSTLDLPLWSALLEERRGPSLDWPRAHQSQ